MNDSPFPIIHPASPPLRNLCPTSLGLTAPYCATSYTLLSPDGFEAVVDEVSHVLRLEVLLGLVLVHNEVTTTLVPVNSS